MRTPLANFAFAIAVTFFAMGSFGEQGCSYGQSVKRGLGAGNGSLTSAANARWAYDWGSNGASSGHNGEYIPMFWNGGGNITATASRLKNSPTSDYVLGFNEPERTDQANISVETAVNRWRTLTAAYEGTEIKLVSPAISYTADGRQWLADFMEAVDSDSSLRVDEVAFHWYGTVNINNPAGGANNFLNAVRNVHNLYGRNVWITEFAGLDFGNNYTTEQMNEWNRKFLDIVLPELDSRDYVTKYAWWNHNNDSRLIETGIYGRSRPTSVGDTYVGTLSSGDTRDMDGTSLGLDFQYLRGGKLLNNGADMGNAFGRMFALAALDGSEQASQFGGSGDWTMNSWGSVTIEENASLQKAGLNTVTFRNLDLEIEGALVLLGGTANEGVLEISGSGTRARGDGIIRLNWPGSNLVLGRAGDTGVLSLGYDLDLRSQSTLTINSDVELTGDASTVGTTFEVNHDFVYDGVLSSTANTGFGKDGAATMTMNGDSVYFGRTTIREGSLIVNGLHFGGNDYNVNGGLLGGSGVIESTVNLNSGSLAPGAETLTGTRFTIVGDLNQAAGTTLTFNVYNNSSDSLGINGTANLAGELVVDLMPDYLPQDGDTITLVQASQATGEFTSVTVLGVPDDFDTDVQINNGNVVLTLTEAGGVVLGDVNQDGVVDFSDIAPFIEYLAGSTYLAEADVDQNGAVDFSDIAHFILLLAS